VFLLCAIVSKKFNMSKEIIYPYLPEGRGLLYVSESNVFMALAKAYSKAQSLDTRMPGAAVLVKNGRVIGIGANGSRYHETHECERIKQKCKTGEGYDLCEGCHPKNHSERRAIDSALGQKEITQGADLYLWGHWWLCKDCWEYIIKFGVNNCYLLENSEILFDKDAIGNIVGKQFL
jgi:deoxycytidylate deaminase